MVVAVGAVVAWNLLFSDSTRALGVDEAVERFRSSTTVAGSGPTVATNPTTTVAATTIPASTTTLPPRTTPTLGVYVYATTGDEAIDALTGVHHTYPAQTTITVVPGGCGVQLRWAPLVERYEQWDECPSPDGGLATHRLHQLPHVLQPGRGRLLRRVRPAPSSCRRPRSRPERRGRSRAPMRTPSTRRCGPRSAPSRWTWAA